ncbi:MAG: hypothetical protein NTU67_00905 [Gemmatimonadetes bacterium]|nr:hypothetical protein [Gemmatimonadota bacterium]
MMRRLVSLFAVVLALPVLASCKGSTSADLGSPLAMITLNARTKAGGYTTAPSANFYRAGSFVLSSAGSATDTCQTAPYPLTNYNTASVIGAGTGVVTTIKTALDTLKRATTVDGTYSGRLTGLSFTPGDTVNFSILGDLSGFPASTVFGKTAEAFTMSAANPPVAGQPLLLTWSPAAPLAAMIVSLRYNDGTGVPTVANAQILCDFVDDGAGTVPAALAARWAAGNITARSTLFQRLRTVVTRGSDATSFINVRSTFELPTPISP